MRHVILALFYAWLVVTPIPGFAQSSGDIDDFVSTVVFLNQDPSLKSPNVGSGFFLATEKYLYLITAAHVASDISLRSSFTISTQDDKPFTFSARQLITAPQEMKWVYSKDADLAALPIQVNPFVLTSLKGHFLSLSEISNSLQAPKREITLTVLGFPLGLGATGLFSPISRDTRPASGMIRLNLTSFPKDATYLLTQDPSIGGFSGSPVFNFNRAFSAGGNMNIVAGRVQVVGLVHGTISDATGGKMGVIIPSFYIHKLLQSMEGVK